jgi:hypothetical protein
MIGATPGSEFARSSKGYQTEVTFTAYVRFLVAKLPAVANGLWRVLILDGFGPHCLCEEALRVLTDNRFIVVCLPSHTSHWLQLHVRRCCISLFIFIFFLMAGRCHLWNFEAVVPAAR